MQKRKRRRKYEIQRYCQTITALLVCCLVCIVAAVAVKFSPWENPVNELARSCYDVSGLTSKELLLLCQDEEFLSEIDGTKIDGEWFSSESMRIRTNENSNTYGSARFADYAKLDVDLVSAVGKI